METPSILENDIMVNLVTVHSWCTPTAKDKKVYSGN